MAAPVAVARQTPAGIMLREGFHSKITFTRFPAVSFWEKTVDPPGYEGGEPIDQTTQFNAAFRTRWPRTLIDVTPISIPDAAYDPNVYNQMILMINVNDTVTIAFQDGSTIAFYGYLRSFNPNPTREGEQPTCSITIVPTNVDSSFAEQAPVVVSVAGS
jgi:hypothetical protein